MIRLRDRMKCGLGLCTLVLRLNVSTSEWKYISLLQSI